MTIQKKVVLGLSAAGVLLATTTLVSFLALRAEVRSNLQHEMDASTDAIVRQLDLANTLYLNQVRSGLRVLRAAATEFGDPHLEGSVAVAGARQPALHFGELICNEDYRVVDLTKEMVGGTATLFVRSGDAFVRVSTNVQTDGGKRAIGTELARGGEAYARLSRGEPFYGLIGILGQPYVTGYEPIFAADRSVIGAYYVGYPLVEMQELGRAIASMGLLERGFVALVDGSGTVVFASSVAPENAGEIVADSEKSGWFRKARDFEPWGYRVVAVASERDIAARTTATTASILGPSLLVFLVIGVLGYLGMRAVVRPLHEVAVAVENVAEGDGDLTRRIDYRREDELGRVASGLNRFLEKIRTSIAVIAKSADVLATTGHQLGQVSESMVRSVADTTSQATSVASAAEQVSVSTSTVASAAEEMQATIQEISRNASRAADASSRAVQSVQGASSIMKHLSESSREIGSVLGLIEAIAEQTNLLALNATIEAARAGESGRGFAVVANEVKELAEQTARATEDIRAKVESMQGDTEAAVGAIDGFSSVIAEIDQVSQSIAGAIEEQAATTREIGKSVNETAQGSQSISSSIQSVAALADRNSSQIREAARLGESLADVTKELKTLLAQFRC